MSFWSLRCISTWVAICSSISLHSFISPYRPTSSLQRPASCSQASEGPEWHLHLGILYPSEMWEVQRFHQGLWMIYRISSVNICQIMNSPLMSDHGDLIKKGVAWSMRSETFNQIRSRQMCGESVPTVPVTKWNIVKQCFIDHSYHAEGCIFTVEGKSYILKVST